MPKVDVIRRDYEVMTPALTDLKFAGPSIAHACVGFDSYRLKKKDDKTAFIGTTNVLSFFQLLSKSNTQ